ncbi:hypothetical protein LC612_37825 [Nostoc sp. CHAB 5834]|nr:hypothetical protein [Nostoc sp. CHAB 5834]
MATEIERKWSLLSLPNLEGVPRKSIFQAYLDAAVLQPIFLTKASTATLRICSAYEGRDRLAWNFEVPLADAEDMQVFVRAGVPLTIRVRVIADAIAFLTLKSPPTGFASRREWEYTIFLSIAEELCSVGKVPSIKKVRYELEGLTSGERGQMIPLVYELDQYLGDLKGLYSVEVELPNAALHVPNLPWMGAEVTGVRAWDNDMLAKQGVPPGALLLRKPE